MATFFGEVLSVYSRAVEEDELDDLEDENEEDAEIRREIEEKREVHVRWCPEVSKAVESSEHLQCSNLVIAVGPSAAGFVSAYVLRPEDWTQVGWVSLWNERSRGSSRPDTAPQPGEPGCVIYRQNSCPSVLVCPCTSYIAEDQLFQWAEKVLGSMQRRGLSVTVLSDALLTEYKTPDYLSGGGAPFLRALKTSAYASTLPCPVLEQPNIVAGLPAAVLSHCQVQRIPAVLFQCFTDVIHPDSVTMETYKPALSCLGASVKKNSWSQKESADRNGTWWVGLTSGGTVVVATRHTSRRTGVPPPLPHHLQELCEDVQAAWDALSQDTIRNLYSSIPRHLSLTPY